MMRIRTLPLLLAITTGLVINTAQAAVTGNLSFTGVVNAGTCNLAAGDENRTIDLPAIKISDFDNGPGAGLIPFDLVANCESDIKNVFFLFAGTPSAGDPTLFRNTGTSGGVALQLAHRNVIVIPANGSPAERTREIPTSGGVAVMRMSANYQITGAAITPGTLVSAATVSITYN